MINSHEQAASRRTAIVSAIVNTCLAAIKTVLGILSNSSALVADGVHSLADLLSDVFTYVMLKVAHEDADDTHPYGHGKFETIGALVMSILLVGTAVGIGWHAVEKYLAGASTLTWGDAAIAAAAISVVANELLFRYCKRIGEKAKSQIVIANAWHHRADGLSSIAALIGIGLSLMGYPVFDAIAAGIVSIMLIHVAWEVGKQAFDELVDAAIEQNVQTSMYAIINKTQGVKHAHFLRARRLGGKIFVDVHVEVDPYISVSEGHMIAELVEARLRQEVEDIADVLVHIDSDDESHDECPVYPDRKELHKLCEKALGEKSVNRMTLHFIHDRMEADIFVNETANVKDAQNILCKPKGPFEKIAIHKTITK